MVTLVAWNPLSSFPLLLSTSQGFSFIFLCFTWMKPGRIRELGEEVLEKRWCTFPHHACPRVGLNDHSVLSLCFAFLGYTKSALYPCYLFSLVASSSNPDYPEHLCYPGVPGAAPLIANGASEGLHLQLSCRDLAVFQIWAVACVGFLCLIKSQYFLWL